MTIQIESMTFSYPGTETALFTEFSEAFSAKEITAVTGRNGCGKTTLAKLILGILKPLKGAVRIDGTPVSSLSFAETGRKIGYVMQDPTKQLFCTSVHEEVSYGLRNMKLGEKEIEERCDSYLDFFEISQYRDTFPFFLSHGEKQRLALAAVLAMQPGYLLLDEPTASLDLYRRKLLGRHLAMVKEKFDCGILLISHDRAFIDSCADREVCLERRPLV